MDAPLGEIFDSNSLQLAPLPEVRLTEPLKSNSFKRVFIITEIFRSLFVGKLAHAEQISTFEVKWQTKGREQHLYREDFQVQEDCTKENESCGLSIPVLKIDEDTFLLCVAEDFLHVPPIVGNLLSQEMAKLCRDLRVLVIGTSDRIEEVKYVGSAQNGRNGVPPLTPPELITSFTASITTQLLLCKVPFDGYVAPSEGPSGYEKLSMETMDKLIDLCWSEISTGNRDEYVKETHRNWRLHGTSTGTQTGLYL